MAQPEEPMVSLLLADTTIAGLVGTRIDPAAREQGVAAVPCITYKRIEKMTDKAFAGRSFLPRVTVEIVCWAGTFAQARQLGEAVDDLLDGWVDAAADPVILKAEPVDSWDEDWDGDDVFYVTQSYVIWYE